VVGAGVAGLAAIGAVSAMGGVVRAFDVPPEVAEQVESMGADFVRVAMKQETSAGGYAKKMWPSMRPRRRRGVTVRPATLTLCHRHCSGSRAGRHRS